jgi:hypothetical protein
MRRLMKGETYGIKNIAKKRGPVFVVPVAMAFPTADTTIKQMIWMLRSPVRPEVYVTSREMRNVANQTGTVRRRVSMCPYPRVLTMDGKKYWNVCERSDRCWKIRKM